MRNRFFLIFIFIIIYSAVSRFWQIDRIPPQIGSSGLILRYFTAFLSVISIFFLYLYVKNLFKNKKLALLSTFVFSVLPWTIEQGRIYSQVNNSLFVFLVFLVFFRRINNFFLKILFFVFCVLLFFIFYPQFWLFGENFQIFPRTDYLSNFFFLSSFTFLFIRNPTFWWGGVREFGVIYLTFLPFFLVGVYQSIILEKWEIWVWFLAILFFSSLSPFLPESREFFLAVPFMTIILALGIYSVIKFFAFRTKHPITFPKFFAWLLLFLFLSLLIYEMSQFFHYYTVHYPQQIRGNLSNIHEPF